MSKFLARAMAVAGPLAGAALAKAIGGQLRDRTRSLKAAFLTFAALYGLAGAQKFSILQFEEVPRPRAAAWAIEGGSAMVGAVVLGVAGGACGEFVGALVPNAAGGMDEGHMLTGAAVGLFTGYALGSAVATSCAGATMREGGRPAAAYEGAGIGTLAAAGIGLGMVGLFHPLTNQSKQTLVVATFVASYALLPPAGAVIGYNLSRPKDRATSSNTRFRLLSIATVVSGAMHSRRPGFGVGFQLVGD